MIHGYTNVYAVITVINTLLDVADTLHDPWLHKCIRGHHGDQHASRCPLCRTGRLYLPVDSRAQHAATDVPRSQTEAVQHDPGHLCRHAVRRHDAACEHVEHKRRSKVAQRPATLVRRGCRQQVEVAISSAFDDRGRHIDPVCRSTVEGEEGWWSRCEISINIRQ